jgi:lysophospholipase L1-like esterase
MQFLSDHKVLSVIIAFIFLIIFIGLGNYLYVTFAGGNVPVPEIPREKITVGSGEQLNLLVLGDSTSVAQGADYDEGYVIKSAELLSEEYQVTHQNFGVSGAVINDVVVDQLPRSEDFTPDLVLVAVAANDVTHLTSLKDIERDTQTIIDELKSRNQDVKIVFTGSASMGDVKRLGYPLRWIAGYRTRQINDVMLKTVEANSNVSFAYIARETGTTFADKGDEFLAADKFHPNAAGYELWTQVISASLINTLSTESE